MLSILLVAGTVACSDADCGEGPGPVEYVSAVERWVRVLPPAPEFPDAGGTSPVLFDFVPVSGGQREGPPRQESIQTHDTFLSDIEDALQEGDSVYLGLQSRGVIGEQTAFVVARDAEGAHRFLGGKCFEGDEGALRSALGDRYDLTLSSIIGTTDGERIREVLSGSISDQDARLRERPRPSS